MKPVSYIAATGLALVLGLNAAPAQAQSNRTFVSGHGSDAPPCSISAPCRSFAFAITQTNAGGEIAVLDTAGYGTVTVTKAVSIINQDGVEAGITTATATDGITIAAGANDVVNLRGLTLVGGGVGINGVTFTSGGTLNIQNCSIRGFTKYGLNLQPGASSRFNVSDTIVSNNGNWGIFVFPHATGTSAFFERVQSIGNSAGFLVDNSYFGTLRATATNSEASGNTGTGFDVFASGAVAATFTVVNSAAVNNGGGIASAGTYGGNATMFVAGSTVAGNATGFYINGGVIKSFGNNKIKDTTNTGTLTTVSQQ